MKELEPNIYAVRLKESITIEFDPQNGAGESGTAVTVDDQKLPSDGGTKPTYVFKGASKSGTHFGKVECSFPGNPPNTARFVVTLTGSVDGEAQFIVKKTDSVKDPNIEFRVKTKAEYEKALKLLDV